MTRAASKGNNNLREAQGENRRFSFKTLMRLLYANFFAPVIIVFLYIHELTGAVMIETFNVEQQTWEVARLGVVFGLMICRYMTFREELQL
jgi:hypothetical protein